MSKTVERAITIKAPEEKVFAYISDPANLPEIWPSLVEVKDVKQSPDGIGSTYRWVYKMAGIHFEGISETTEYAANERLVIVGKGGIDAKRISLFQPVEDGMKYSTVVEYTIPIPLLGKLAEAIIVKLNENEAKVILSNLKAVMEAAN